MQKRNIDIIRFLQGAISIADEAIEMADEGIIPISRINRLRGYLQGGLETIELMENGGNRKGDGT